MNTYNEDDIKVIYSDTDKIRARHDMYIGYHKTKAFEHLIKEVLQNSFDELEAVKNSYVPKIIATYDRMNNCIIISDNGRGIPINKLVEVCTILQSSAKMKKGKEKSYNKAAGKNGAGLKAANALSTKCVVKSTRDGKCRTCIFEKGKLVNDSTENAPKKEHGTTVLFIPDEEILGKTDLTKSTFINLCDTMCYITGASMEACFISKNGKEEAVTISHQKGIRDLLCDIVNKSIIKPIYIKSEAEDDRMNAEVIFTWVTDKEDLNIKGNDNDKTHIISFANFCTTVDHGKHVDGFIKGINAILPKYTRENYLNSNNKNNIDITPEDVQDGLVAIVNLNHVDATFVGQVKTKLGNDDASGFIRKMVYDGLKEWLNNSTTEKDKLCRYFKEIASLRNKVTQHKKIYNNKTGNTIFDVDTKKYLKPNKSKHIRVWIVEGDSAGGTIDTYRNKDYEGIVKLRGVLKNSINSTLSEVNDNAETKLLLNLTNLYNINNKERDINKCPVDEFFIATDADPDGGRITSSIIVLFFVHAREVIDAGRLYKVVPPLYKIDNGRGKPATYLKDGKEYAEYLQKQIVKTLDLRVNDSKGKKMTKKDITDLILESDEYYNKMKRAIRSFVIDHNVLDFIVKLYPYLLSDLSGFKKRILKQYKDTEFMEDKKGNLIMKTLLNKDIEYMMFDEITMKRLSELNIIRKNMCIENSNFYDANYGQLTLIDLLEVIHSFEPKNKERYKGLGEMSKNEVKELLMNPDNRNLVRITYTDVEKALHTLSVLHSDSKKYMGLRKEMVKQFNKLSADELDT